MKEKNIKLYNVIFPIWLLIWMPSWLWLILIPLNYLVDVFVLRWGLKARPDRSALCRSLGWKVCLAGFLSDFIASALLLALLLINSRDPLLLEIQNGIGIDPFRNVPAMLVTAAAIALAAVLIYLFDSKILKRSGIEPETVRGAALRLAIVTAPYLFFIPSKWFYRW